MKESLHSLGGDQGQEEEETRASEEKRHPETLSSQEELFTFYM